jgi:UDPglucose--hexose-1-phosphate uridylyltransferase
MPELRQDPLSGRWVIIAENRAARPDQFATKSEAGVEVCPFCPGHENLTPKASAVYPVDSSSADWRVRVVPNKYPAVELNASGDRGEAAIGVHEVIIESRAHVASLTDVSAGEAELTFLAYRDRLRFLSNDKRLSYGLVFKNARADGGASLEHAHSQLIATSTIPADVQYELAKAGEHQMLHGSCAFCDLIDGELNGARHVFETDSFAVFCPFSSRFPYEMWVLPKTHCESFETTPDAKLVELAELMQKLIQGLEIMLDAPAYNYWIRNAPFRLSSHDDYHWRIELTPRMTRLAGFELGTGCFINPVSPEEAAARLRAVLT